jgi:putative FmdB family regulatory protein
LPLYEYRCTSCGYSFEKIQNFSAEPEKECPKCHGVLIRPVTAPALRFEGAGWYVNDYAGKGAATKSSESSESKAGDGGGAKETKTEAKAGSASGTGESGGTAAAAPAGNAASSAAGSTSS